MSLYSLTFDFARMKSLEIVLGTFVPVQKIKLHEIQQLAGNGHLVFVQ